MGMSVLYLGSVGKSTVFRFSRVSTLLANAALVLCFTRLAVRVLQVRSKHYSASSQFDRCAQ